MKKNLFIIILICTVCFILGGNSHADVVVIKVRVVNPLDERMEMPMRYAMPKGVKPEDILAFQLIRRTKKMAVGEKETAVKEKKEETNVIELKSSYKTIFNEDEGVYYVEKQMFLDPKEFVVLEFKVRDIWMIEEKGIVAMRSELESVVAKIQSSKERSEDSGEISESLINEIEERLNEIEKMRNIDTIMNVGVKKHIEAYEESIEILQQIIEDLEMLKHL